MGRNKNLLQHFSISLIVLFICFITIVSSMARREAAQTRCIEKERIALLQFKNGFVDDYSIFSSWGRRSHDCCLWKGVGCSNRTGHVIMLDLHGHWSQDLQAVVGFSGEIDSSLLKLHHLEHLDLALNKFTQIPQFIGSLTKLRYLNLTGIQLEVSEVPTQLGNLSHLQTLDLTASTLLFKDTGWLSKLSSLRYLSLNYLDLSGSNNLLQNTITRLPSLSVLKLRNCGLPNVSVGSLVPLKNLSNSLSILDLSENNLASSSIYPWLWNFSGTLTNIDLSNNMLLGTIPEDFGAFKSIENLNLVKTCLNGGIPKFFGNFSNLRSLYLAGNNLTADLPSFFRFMAPTKKSLHVLDLSWNKISGSVPDFTTFTALKELYLSWNDLTGSFPNKFERKSNLTILDLRSNKLSGFLPDLSALYSLRELYFESNRMEGTLAEKIMSLSELQFLGVSSNHLHGTISEAHLANLSRLVYLDMSHNSLVLKIDSGWSPPFSLDTISLSSCKLGPSFPTWLQTQKTLSIIDISDAQIDDFVPNWFWEQLTPSLRYLNLSSNQLHGTVPDLMFGDQQRPYIDLSHNKFLGSVPLFPFRTFTLLLQNNMFSGSLVFLWNLTSIGYLDLSNNLLSGGLPDFWMNFDRLFYLNLGNNNFTGRIPTSMGSLLYVASLSLRNNSLTGVLPSSLQNCMSLQVIDVGENNLRGPIPDWIGNSLSELVVLSLSYNGFHGTMPTSLCRLATIQILDISVNKISGNIPKCLSSLKAMTEREYKPLVGFNVEGLSRTRLSLSQIQYVYNALLQWKGREFEYRSTLGLVNILDISSNNFNGEIPHDITNLLGLVALNLSRNNFTGKIPQDIGRLRWLDFLDLSENYLVGGIPTSLTQLTNLGMLDLSNNSLSGRIPTSTQLQSFGISSYTGNPALCGLPLPISCPGELVPQNPWTTVETDDAGDQDKLITRGFFITLLIGLAFGFWGVFGTLVVNNSWRYAYLSFLRHVEDWIYVSLAVNYSTLKRRYWFNPLPNHVDDDL